MAKRFDYEDCKVKIPMFRQEHFKSGKGKYVCGKFGVNIDAQMGGKDFEYLIADDCDPNAEIPRDLKNARFPRLSGRCSRVTALCQRRCRMSI